MLPRKTTFFLVIFIAFIIVFDALQQKYYLETFNLEPANITFSQLFKNHLIRWSIWALVSIPFSIFIWKRLIPRNDQSPVFWLTISCAIFSTFVSIIFITIYNMIDQQITIFLDVFSETFIFFIFQKGLAFILAFSALSLILFNQSKGQLIQEQSIVIENLERKSTDLESVLKSTQSTAEPHLNVKTGYKMKPIPLSDIIWIQSDDYCVKIHTNEKSFTLRQSLKVLEQKLSHYQFIRIHRGALLNMLFLDQVNYEASTIQLTNDTKLPLSKSGIQTLKKRLQESSI